MVKLEDELALDASLLCGIKEFSSANEKPSYRNALSSYSKPICPYISSTFFDLEEEFKYLHANVFPQLNELCLERESYFLPFDFRRTAIENRTSADSILKHSLNNVLSALPYFICVMGNSYGKHRPPSSALLSNSKPDSLSIPSTQNLSMMDQNLLAASNDYPWVIDEEFHTCSMMELEITLACFMSETHFPKRCSFYIKESVLMPEQGHAETFFEGESEYAQNRLLNLKSRIVEKGFPVNFFTSTEDLAEKVFREWSEIILATFPSPDSCQVPGDELSLQWHQHEKLLHKFKEKYLKHADLAQIEFQFSSHAFTIAEHSLNAQKSNQGIDNDLYSKDEASVSGYKVGDGLFTTAASFLDLFRQRTTSDAFPPDDNSILAVVGEPGSGKTALLSNWLRDFRKSFPDVLIITEFVGVSHLSHDLSSFLRRCIRTMREKHFDTRSTSRDLLSDSYNYKSLVDSFSSALQLQPCLIIIDNIHEFHRAMDEDIGTVKGLGWLPLSIPPSCKLIVTTQKSDLTFKVLQTRNDVQFAFMSPIEAETKFDILSMHLKPHVLESLTSDTFEKIFSNKFSELPLFLSVLSDLLNACRASHGRYQVAEMCTSFRTFRDFWKCVFALWSHKYSWNKNSAGQPGSIRGRLKTVGWVIDVLKLISLSRSGLRRSEIVHLLSLLGYRARATVTFSDWDMFYAAAGNLLQTGSDGLIKITCQGMLIAVRNSLFKNGRSSSRGDSSFNIIEGKHQRFHSLLASYFLKFGTLDRKLTELPWQFSQSCDWTALCSVLCKPRFFLAMCKQSQWRPSLYVDHITYWKQLVKHDFDVYHCLQGMFDQPLIVDRDGLLYEGHVLGKSVQSATADGLPRGKPTAAISAKAPSMIIVTQHDDVSIHKSTEDSKSETEERDFSETESSSFFLTDTEAEHSALLSGWHPAEDNPEVLIDSRELNENELFLLRHKVAWFLFQLGDEYRSKAEEFTLNLIDRLNLARPLTHSQLLTYFEAVALGSEHRCVNDLDILLRGLETFDYLSLESLNLNFAEERDLKERAACLRLRVADELIKENRHQDARVLILHVFGENRKWKTIYCKIEASRVFGVLFMSLGLSPQSEEMLMTAFSICVKWKGKKHVDVAGILKDMGRLYSCFFPSDRDNYRKAMLVYKQALEVLRFNNLEIEAGNVSHLIGQLLVSEGSLSSLKEASSCFIQCLDTYVTNEARDKNVISKITSQYKKAVRDIKSGKYLHGQAKPTDRRTSERPYSAMSYHSRELSRISQKEDISPRDISDIKTQRSLMNSVSTTRPYSTFSARSYGNRVLITPRSFDRQKVIVSPPTTRPPSRQRSSFSQFKEGSKQNFVDGHTSNRETESQQPSLTVMNTIKKRPDTSEGKEHPVIIVGGQTTKFDSEGRETSRQSIKRPETREGNPRSEISTPKRSVRLFTKPQIMNQTRPSPPKHHCFFVADNIELSVHGPHSTLVDLYNTTLPASRGNRSVDVYHKTAWYHVPGRYVKPGEILPSKRSQFHKRPSSSAGSSSLAYRSGSASRSASRLDKSNEESSQYLKYDNLMMDDSKTFIDDSRLNKEVIFVDG